MTAQNDIVQSGQHAEKGEGVDLVVVGLGYVGLPLVQAATKAGLRVTGLDLNKRVVEGLNSGRSHVDDLSDAEIAAILTQGFTATTDDSVISRTKAVVICVPTPLTEHGAPDLGAVEGAVASVAAHMRPGMLVVLESTTYPGTTDEVVRPALEARGLVAGVDFHLAFSPERIDPEIPSTAWRTRRRSSADTRRPAPRPLASSTRTLSARSSRPRARARPRWRSCSRTPIGTST